MIEALRLADLLETGAIWQDQEAAAAELRRLHAENERLRQINQSHEMKLSVRGYEIQIDDLKALNAELVEALRVAVDSDLGAKWIWHESGREAWVNNARAALAKVEDSK